MKVQKINVGLASYGLSGQVFHAPFIDLHPNLELTAICERSKSLAALRYPHSEIVRSYDNLLKKTNLDLIIVNTPNHLHFSMAKKALENGKHVVVEKPFGTSFDEAKELITLAESNKLTLAVYQNRRLESGFKTLKSIVDNNKLGKLTYFKTHFNRDKSNIGPKEWKENSEYPGSGLFYDLAPHLIDQALTLFGNPKKVNCVFEKQRPNTDIDDYFLITLNYSSGLKVELEAGMYIKQENEPKYLLKGEKGTYSKEKEDHQEWLLRQGIFPSSFDPDQGKIIANNGFLTPVKNVKGSYNDFYANLYDHLTEKSKLLIKPYEALEVMKIMEHCLLKREKH